MGSLTCLNVGLGDGPKITFDTADEKAAADAKRIIEDMLKRGYALLVEVGGAYQRAVGFDAMKGEYIVALSEKDAEVMIGASKQAKKKPGPKKGSRRGPRRTYTRVGMAAANAVGVARSAGG